MNKGHNTGDEAKRCMKLKKLVFFELSNKHSIRESVNPAISLSRLVHGVKEIAALRC